MKQGRRTAQFAGCLVALVLVVVTGAICMAQEKAAPAGDVYVNFSFDGVDVDNFVKMVGAMTGRKFDLGEDVKGKITVVSPPVSRREVYPLFVSILEHEGFAIVEDGEISRVVALDKRAMPMAPVVGVDEELPASGIITKVHLLKSVKASSVKKVLEARVAGGNTGAVSSVDETNHIIITDTVASIRRMLKLIDQLDQPGLSRARAVVQLEFASAEDLADQLTAAMSERETRGSKLLKRLPSTGRSGTAQQPGVSVVASSHANSVILVGTPSQLQSMRVLIEKLDVDAPTGRGMLNPILLKYIDAVEIAESLTKLFEKSYAAATAKDGETRRIAIEALEASNAIVVNAMPGDFDGVRRLIDQLDVRPQQVHIEVMIAEVSEGDEYNLGVEMGALDMPSTVGDNVWVGGSTLGTADDSVINTIQSGLFPGGLTFGIAHGAGVDADGNVILGYPGILSIDAMKKLSNFEILSETALGVENNQEATVSVVDDIPILKSTLEGTGTSRDVVQNIERYEVGIKLTLTPHIVPGGDVQMVLNPSIEAVTDPGPDDVNFAPTFAKREVSTTVTVADGRTIVIAGLTRRDKQKIVKKVPLLGSIPILGFLFRSTTDAIAKSDLLIFVTPRIVSNSDGADAVREAWEKKTGLPRDEDE